MVSAVASGKFDLHMNFDIRTSALVTCCWITLLDTGAMLLWAFVVSSVACNLCVVYCLPVYYSYFSLHADN